MTPEDQQAVAHHTREIAKILHRNPSAEAVKTLEGIEKTVRGQVLEHVSPEIALFLSQSELEQDAAEHEKSSVRWGRCD